MKENNNSCFFDGAPKKQDELIKSFFETFANDENERAMSDEFAYLDDDTED